MDDSSINVKTKGRTLIRIIGLLAGICLASQTALVCGCAKQPKGESEQPPSVSSPGSPQVTEPTPPADEHPQASDNKDQTPPKSTDIREAVDRVFKGAVAIDSSTVQYFVVGDFNGDSSQDIAVVVRPVEDRLPEINNELANWMIRDPLGEVLPTPRVILKETNPEPRPVKVGPKDLLLAVIHGYGRAGWHDQEATQTYLLKHGASGTMTVRSKKVLYEGKKGKRLPLALGDVITQVRGGLPGFLYYTGSTYVWYDPSLRKRRRPHDLKSEAG